MKIAVIDIGSNSVRLMMWADGKTLYKRVCTTRLGAGIAERPVLREDAIVRTAEAVAAFARTAEEEGAEQTAAFATAAVRSAENGGLFCKRVKELCGLIVDVVPGEEEAQLGLAGVLGNGDGGMIDVGGASTEYCCRKGRKTLVSLSMNVGAVRLFDACGDDKDKLTQKISLALSALDGVKAQGKTYAVGGTATTLACVALGLEEYDASRVQDLRITAEEMDGMARRLLAMTAEERKAVKGMDVRRADIIGGGALLLSETMKKLSVGEIYVSDRDNLEGYLVRRMGR